MHGHALTAPLLRTVCTVCCAPLAVRSRGQEDLSLCAACGPLPPPAAGHGSVATEATTSAELSGCSFTLLICCITVCGCLCGLKPHLNTNGSASSSLGGAGRTTRDSCRSRGCITSRTEAPPRLHLMLCSAHCGALRAASSPCEQASAVSARAEAGTPAAQRAGSARPCRSALLPTPHAPPRGLQRHAAALGKSALHQGQGRCHVKVRGLYPDVARLTLGLGRYEAQSTRAQSTRTQARKQAPSHAHSARARSGSGVLLACDPPRPPTHRERGDEGALQPGGQRRLPAAMHARQGGGPAAQGRLPQPLGAGRECGRGADRSFLGLLWPAQRARPCAPSALAACAAQRLGSRCVDSAPVRVLEAAPWWWGGARPASGAFSALRAWAGREGALRERAPNHADAVVHRPKRALVCPVRPNAARARSSTRWRSSMSPTRR